MLIPIDISRKLKTLKKTLIWFNLFVRFSGRFFSSIARAIPKFFFIGDKTVYHDFNNHILEIEKNILGYITFENFKSIRKDTSIKLRMFLKFQNLLK